MVETVASTGARILIVEDEALVAADLGDRLERIGHVVVGMVDTGLAAIQTAMEARPQLVLMDIRLKGPMDGIEAADEIYRRLGVPIVYVTAHADHATLRRASAAARFGYLVKPFEEAEMVVAIDMALQRHRVETFLRESQLTVDAILAGIRDAVVATDEKAAVRFMNPVAEVLTGWRLTEAQGLPFETVVVLDGTSRDASPVQSVLRRGDAPRGVPLVLRCRDERALPVEVTVTRATDPAGRIIGAVAVICDVSERHWAERSFSGLLESAADPMIIADQTGAISILNGQAEELFGYLRDELRGEPIEKVIPEHLREVHRERRSSYLEAPHPRPMGRGLEVVGRRKDGSHFPAEISLGVLHTERGVMISASIRDATHRHEQQARLRAHEERFRTVVEHASDGIFVSDPHGAYADANSAACALLGYTREELLQRRMSDVVTPEEHGRIDHEIARLRDGPTRSEWTFLRKDGTTFSGEVLARQLPDGRLLAFLRDVSERKRQEHQVRQTQKLEALGTLASGVAHDFNNLLNVILLNVQHAESRLSHLPDPSTHESLRDIRTAALRARDVVGRILTFGRKQPVHAMLVDPTEEVSACLSLLRPAVPAHVELATELAPDLPSVMADPTQLHQVILNLCTNAWQAIGARRGRIVVGGDQVELSEGVAPPCAAGSYVRISVTDDGPGMDASTAARVFDPFFTTRASSGGSGLGLSVVHGIVQAHRGAITLDTTPGGGAAFHVYLPARERRGAPAAVAEPRLRQGRGELVLVIDDEKRLLAVVTRTLEELGYRVAAFASPGHAIAAFREAPQRYAAALVDFAMPEASGIDVAGELLNLRPTLPIAIVSGYTVEETRARAREIGVRSFVQKPATRETLAGTLGQLIDGSAPPAPADPP